MGQAVTQASSWARRPGRTAAAAKKLRRWPIAPVLILVLLISASTLAPLIAPHSARVGSLADRHRPPVWQDQGSPKYILGTDSQGRDIVSRLLWGGRISFTVATVTLLIGASVGTVLGMASGYFGGWVDELVMRLVDAFHALPIILAAMILAVILGQNFGVLILILVATMWSRFARQVRGEVLRLREMDYVALARVAGASPQRILKRHILPGLISTLTVVATLQLGNVILAEATLSFLGVGMPPPNPSWGVMVSDGRQYIAVAWWVSFFPGLAILLVVLSMNFLGDWLRDHFDPRLRQLV